MKVFLIILFLGLPFGAFADGHEGEDQEQKSCDRMASFQTLFDQMFSASDVLWHGSHLCSDDEHCGSGHKCCDGHCKQVATCP